MRNFAFGRVDGLPEEEQEKLNRLKYIYDYHRYPNKVKSHYYDGDIRLSEVNLGIALPANLKKLKIGCAWGTNTVDVLARRSMFDGFVADDGGASELMARIVDRNNLIPEYLKACQDELKYGCSFASVSGTTGAARIRFISPECAAAAWDEKNGRIGYAFAFEDLRDDESNKDWIPEYVNLYTDTDTWELHRIGGRWFAQRYPHKFGAPMIEPLIWNATSSKPFGQSRLKKPIRSLIQGYIRTVANATIGLEFATSPQKYLLGVTDDMYDSVIDNKFRQYVGSILTATQNPETGQNPAFGQLPQGNIEPHIQMMRLLATQFSAATGLPVTDTGVINDANPTSSDAITAQTKTLVAMAERLNQENGERLNSIARMAQAVELNTTPDSLPEENKNVIAHFKNPSMPSIAVTADAAIKIASVREGFSSTDVFLEMLGFDQADIRRIKAQEQRTRGIALLNEEIA